MKNTSTFSTLLLSCMLVFVLAACSGSHTDWGAESQDLREINTDPEQTPEKSENGKIVLTFSTFYENDFYKRAEMKYESMHPNIDIELSHQHESGMNADWDNWETIHEQFVKTTNTQILTGKGPDILQLDELPIGQYIHQNALVNFSARMEKDPDFQKDQYFTNILDNVKMNDSLYAIPLRFYLDGYIGDQEAIEQTGVPFDDANWTWEEFIEKSKEMVDKGEYKHAFSAATPGGLLNNLVQAQYSEFVDEANRKANFHSEAFIGMMNQVKEMVDHGVVLTEARMDETYFQDGILLSFSDYLRKTNNDFGEKFYIKPHKEGQAAGGHFQPFETIGINANSPYKEEAWKFVSFLMSDELEQTADSLLDPSIQNGFPINKSIYQKRAQQLLQIGKMENYEGTEFEITDKDFQTLESYLAGAVHPVEYRTTLVQEIIYEESKAFFTGHKTAEDVAKLIENRVNTYLNE